MMPAAVAPSQARCDFSDLPGVVWWGTQRQMTLERLAEYLAPVYWFSPDEPLLRGGEGADIRIPEAFPFEEQPEKPVVYYQFGQMVAVAAGVEGFDETAVPIVRDPTNPGNAVVDFERVVAFTMHFWAYFSSEEGLGAHIHDIEGAEFRLMVLRDNSPWVLENSAGRCSERTYVAAVTRVSGLAHGVIWFWNVSETDKDSRFPMHLLVEEGKHALATDKNSDGYFTPGYDVSRYVNDAWGIRDNMRTGAMATGGYQSWMTKVRQDPHRVAPPLPEDSPLRPRLERQGYYDGSLAVYELRPFPPTEKAEGDPHHLVNFFKDKEVLDWPETREVRNVSEFDAWFGGDLAVKSLSIALLLDGDVGATFVFPLLIVKNVEVPAAGGFFVHRMYVKDDNLRDFGWQLMYVPSASRWVDTYFAAGAEHDRETDSAGVQTVNEWKFVLETGLKFRFNLSHSPMKFLSVLTDFWGFSAGIKNYGFFRIDRLTYVFQLGAGVW
ncbi:MAG: hypothetical protein OEY20_16550 [Gemmatimonadota bacterium]|nr:hypothetical protein [Gemmatimonadota bacterium]